ncbi:hypothetical protein [Asticcacaulis solisilvae]|uniref:hypothetical protein n=1 Tax=Asticcacaulis solisilvae TaxID=1217274 RepID=UPI003FD8C8E5
MSPDQEKSYEAMIAANLTRVNDFLKFAETKHAALLAFCSAWMLGISATIYNPQVTDGAFKTRLAYSLIFLGISAIIALSSFVASLLGGQHNTDYKKGGYSLFFGAAASKTFSHYKQEIENKYKPAQQNIFEDHYIEDLLCQMHTNSKIANTKYIYFNVAAIIAIAGVITAVASAIFTLAKQA